MAEKRIQSRRVGRPIRPVLSESIIIDAALRLIGADGTAGLTMHGLASRLKVSTSALYNHVRGKEHVLTLVQDRIMAQVDTASMAAVCRGELSLGAGLRHWGISYREVFARHPELIEPIATLPVSGARASRAMYDVVAAGLVAGGIPLPRVIPVIVAFESFLFGSAIDVHAPSTVFSSQEGEDDAVHFRQAVESFTDAVSDAAGPSAGNLYADPPFDWGMAALIASAEAMAVSHGSGAGSDR